MRHQLAVKQIIGRQSVDLKGSLDPQVRRDRAVQLDPKEQLVLECRVQQAKLDQLAQLGSKVQLVLAKLAQLVRQVLLDQRVQPDRAGLEPPEPPEKLEPRAKSGLRAKSARLVRRGRRLKAGVS